jgi:hypothetical protein
MPKPLIHAHYKGWASMDPEGIYGLKAWRGRRGAEQCQRYLEMTRSRPEQQIQRAVFEHLAIRAASTVFAFHPANGGWRSRVEAAILKGMGVKAGVPDIIAIKDARCYALELKASGGRLTPVQRDAHAALVAAGAEVAVAYGLDDALGQLEAWGLLRGSCQGRWP